MSLLASVTTTVNEWLTDTLLGRLTTVVLVVVLALLARWILHRFVNRTTRTLTEDNIAKRLIGAGSATRADQLVAERYRARTHAVGGLLKSVGTFVIGAVAVIAVLARLGLNVAPILASAGVVGIAIGFGAQTIVRDFLSGVFMILEDQYGIGDIVTVNGVTGTVEEIGLRVTRLRDVEGTLWYVSNGSVSELGNRSQGWSLAVVDVPVGYGADLAAVKALLAETAAALQADPEWGPRVMIDEPRVSVESMTPLAVSLRVQLHTEHDQQFAVARELRMRSVAALESAGVPTPSAAGPAAGATGPGGEPA